MKNIEGATFLPNQLLINIFFSKELSGRSFLRLGLYRKIQNFTDLGRAQQLSIKNDFHKAIDVNEMKTVKDDLKNVIVRRKGVVKLDIAPKFFFAVYPKMQEFINQEYVTQLFIKGPKLNKKKNKTFFLNGPVLLLIMIFY